MKRKAKPKPLKCERPGCGHGWGIHAHGPGPVPQVDSERCTVDGCACSGYIGYGPASLR